MRILNSIKPTSNEPLILTNKNNSIKIGDLVSKPDTIELNTKNDKKKKTVIIAAIIATVTAAVTAAVLLIKHKLNVDKAKKLAQEVAEQARKSSELENIAKNVKGVKDNLTGEKISLEEFINRYLHDYDMAGKTIYHGTGLETAQIIKEQGIKGSYRGAFQNKFNGAYFTEKLDLAKRYAEEASSRGQTITGMFEKPVNITGGGIVQATLPKGSKLAQFTNNDGKFFSLDILEDILTPETSKALETGKLKPNDLIEYIQDTLKKKGYDGIRHFEAHTGPTPIIFNREKLIFGDIIKP